MRPRFFEVGLTANFNRTTDPQMILSLCFSLPLVAPASWVQHNKCPQRSARHDPRCLERGPVSLEPIRGPQARQHRSQGPLHHPERRKPHRGLHDSREEEGRVWGLSRVRNKLPLCELFKADISVLAAGSSVRHAHHRGRPVLLPAVWEGTGSVRLDVTVW